MKLRISKQLSIFNPHNDKFNTIRVLHIWSRERQQETPSLYKLQHLRSKFSKTKQLSRLFIREQHPSLFISFPSNLNSLKV